uniref:Uncharacterized protein n=1 Tax=Sphaerodactylus townsendi TaxID=933632 RepID=A0ACB8F821_9SAUR
MAATRIGPNILAVVEKGAQDAAGSTEATQRQEVETSSEEGDWWTEASDIKTSAPVGKRASFSDDVTAQESCRRILLQSSPL